MSLTLPWEVIENVVDHSSGSAATLYSFALTCRQLNPRSTTVLLHHVELKDRKELFSLCALLQAKPHLQGFVRSVKMPPHEFSPCPLLRMARNLFEIEFVDEELKDSHLLPPLTLHMAVKRPCCQFGEGVQTLSLQYLRFSSLSAFSDILLLFPNLRSLSCTRLEIASFESLPDHEAQIGRRLNARLRLTTLAITGLVTGLLLKWLGEVTKRMVVTLSWTTVGFIDEAVRSHLEKVFLPSPSECLHLKSFVLQVTIIASTEHNTIQHVVGILNHLRSAKLQDVTVDFRCAESIVHFVHIFPSASALGLCSELETVLLGFLRPRISFCFDNPIKVHRGDNAWMARANKYFPILAERHALSATFRTGFSCKVGHDSRITAFVTSMDSKWLATAAHDGFIMIWDLARMRLSTEWFAHEFGVDSLAFSPSSQHLISASLSGEVTVWDLNRDPFKIISPARKPPHSVGYANRCSWAVDASYGSWAAAGSKDGVVRIWDARTFQRLHVQAVEGQLQASSPDGRWIITAAVSDSEYCPCRIWSVKTGRLHRELRGHSRWISCAAFDPASARVVTGSDDSTIRIWDVKTGEELLLLNADRPARRIDAVAFSPDGNLVLSTPCMLPGRAQAAEIWDANSGALLTICSDTPDGLAGPFACFSPCGRYIVSVEDGAVLLWSTHDWSRIAKVSEDGSKVHRVAISPDNRVLCCGDWDGTVFFRRMSDLVQVPID